jgi:hypothetical protein
MSGFTAAQWQRINDLLATADDGRFGLPTPRHGSVLLASFNLQNFGTKSKWSQKNWDFLRTFAKRCDLLAVQEVLDNLTGLRRLQTELGTDYGMVVSDVTGGGLGRYTAAERLAFLFRWTDVERTEVASDISYDRTLVFDNLYGAWDAIRDRFDAYVGKRRSHEQTGHPKRKPKFAPPAFVTFIRTPACVSFRIPGTPGATPYEFLAVDAHLLYGSNKSEREDEFWALMEWLIARAKAVDNLYHKNIILFGDLNLDFEGDVDAKRAEITEKLKSLNVEFLGGDDGTVFNFPFLDPHPEHGEVYRTNARRDQTFDHIAFLAHDAWVPRHGANGDARHGGNGFDYGVFDYVDLIATALHGAPFAELSKTRQDAIFTNCKADISDHMPIWVRLPKPGLA